MEKYYISDRNWQKLYKVLRFSPKIRVKVEETTRTFVEGVHFILKTGAQWRELPAYYGKWRSVHKRYESWCRKGVWSDVLQSFSCDCDTEWFMIDATIVRAHPCAAGYERDQHEREALGRSKGGFTTKIHALVDALGQAVRFTLTPGHRDIVMISLKPLRSLKVLKMLIFWQIRGMMQMRLLNKLNLNNARRSFRRVPIEKMCVDLISIFTKNVT